MTSIKTKNTFLSPKDKLNPQPISLISEPKIVGVYSIDGQRRFVSDRRNCKYLYKNYHLEPVQYDLKEGIESAIRKAETYYEGEKINNLLHFILENINNLKENNEISNTKSLSADVVCYRGSLQCLMSTPYQIKKPWIILASKYKGTIYLWEKDTDEQTKERLNQTDDRKKIRSCGFKFEQFLLTGRILTKKQYFKSSNENFSNNFFL